MKVQYHRYEYQNERKVFDCLNCGYHNDVETYAQGYGYRCDKCWDHNSPSKDWKIELVDRVIYSPPTASEFAQSILDLLGTKIEAHSLEANWLKSIVEFGKLPHYEALNEEQMRQTFGLSQRALGTGVPAGL